MVLKTLRVGLGAIGSLLVSKMVGAEPSPAQAGQVALVVHSPGDELEAIERRTLDELRLAGVVVTLVSVEPAGSTPNGEQTVVRFDRVGSRLHLITKRTCIAPAQSVTHELDLDTLPPTSLELSALRATELALALQAADCTVRAREAPLPPVVTSTPATQSERAQGSTGAGFWLGGGLSTRTVVGIATMWGPQVRMETRAFPKLWMGVQGSYGVSPTSIEAESGSARVSQVSALLSLAYPLQLSPTAAIHWSGVGGVGFLGASGKASAPYESQTVWGPSALVGVGMSYRASLGRGWMMGAGGMLLADLPSTQIVFADSSVRSGEPFSLIFEWYVAGSWL